MPLVPSASPPSVAIKSSGLLRTIPSVSERMGPPTSRLRPSPTSVLPLISTSGVRQMVMKPRPPTSSLLNQRPNPPSYPSPVKIFPTSRGQPSIGRPKVDTSSTKRRKRTSRSSAAEAKLQSLSKPLLSSRRRASRLGLSLSPRGLSSIGKKRATG